MKNTAIIFKHSLSVLCASCLLVACSPAPENAQTSSNQTATDTDAHTKTDKHTQHADAPKASNDNSHASDHITITTPKGDISLPVNPKPIAVYDMATMQDLSALGVPVQGLPAKLLLDNLVAKDAPKATEVGTLFEPNLETLHAMQPQAIFIGGRTMESYDALKNIAPTLDVSRNTKDIYISSKERLATFGKLFEKTAKAAELQANIDKAITEAKQAATGKGNGLIIMVNGNKLSAFGANSRFGFIHTTFGVPLADNNIKTARHGQPVSFEYVKQTNPDWLFVLDRTSAIGREGIGAEKVLDNALVKHTNAWKNQQIVYLSPDSYLAFGGYYQWMTDAQTIKAAFSKAN